MIAFAPQGQRLSDCERLRIERAFEISIRPQRRAHGRLRFAWRCRQRAGCTMGIGVRVRSSKLARRRLSLPYGSQSPFLIRPARAAGRRDVIDVTILVPNTSAVPYAARWRVVL